MIAAHPRSCRELRSRNAIGLRISDFERISSLLMSVLMLSALAVTFMFVIWLCDRAASPVDHRKASPEVIAGGHDNDDSPDESFEPPGQQEITELSEIELSQSLQAVTDAVSRVAASVDSLPADQANTGPVGRPSNDARPVGPPGPTEVPRFERWSLKFNATSIEDYARQLDHFGIELGVLGGTQSGIDYASKFSAAGSVRHADNPSSEQRLYFRFTQATALRQWDRMLVRKAGIEIEAEQILLKFIPAELENKLAAAELDYAATNGYSSIQPIAKTVFESQPAGDGYRFVIIQQRIATREF